MKNNENSHRNSTNGNTGKGNPDKNTMNKSIAKRYLSFATISFLMLMAGGIVIYLLYTSWNQKYLSLMEEQRNSFTGQLTERDALINEWILTFDQIEQNLNIIKEKEQIITMRSSDVEFSADKKQQILDDIKFINTLLDENKMKIASLNNQLQKSGGTIKGMQNKLNDLEAAIKHREQEIIVLKTALEAKDFEIIDLNSRMTDLQIIVAQQDERITDQKKEIATQAEELNTAFLVYGTFKDLKEMGLISKEGGILKLGKKGTLAENFDESYFTPIKITETRAIPVHSKNVKLITKHPAESYELFRDEATNQIAYIEIKDPDEFWKISKYAVVEINK